MISIACHVRTVMLVTTVVLGQALPGTAQTPATPVTFTKDVAPIFQAKCEACHRPDSIAPMSLRTYEETRPWARSIRTRVADRQMPPWHIDKTVGIQAFQNDRSLTDAELATVLAWIDQGAVKGDMKDMPAARRWPEGQGWNYAAKFGQQEPDLVIRNLPWTMKAGGGNTWFKRLVDSGVTEPRWVRAIEVRPGTVKGRRIVHHANVEIDQVEPDGTSPTDASWNGPWAKKGSRCAQTPAGSSCRVRALPSMCTMRHTTEDVTDAVEMGLYFYPKGQEPKYRQSLVSVGSSGANLDIPPNSVASHEGFFVLQKAARIESFQPHMHLRGKAQALEAILPTGQTVMLSHVDNFSFNWHNSYIYADDVAPLLPKGTVLKATSWHDNTRANKANPDPDVWVGYGERTVDEMNHVWVSVTYLDDADYLAEVDARRTATPQRRQPQ